MMYCPVVSPMSGCCSSVEVSTRRVLVSGSELAMNHDGSHLRSRIGRALGAMVVAVVALGAFASPAAAKSSGADHATAVIRNGVGQLTGWAKFTEDATGVVHVNIHVKGLTPGLHGTHVHAVGLCEGPSFLSAGSHYNPFGRSHGAHAGDLPNLAVNRAGVGHLNAKTELASLSNLAGRALIIHAGEDDLVTNPTGNSGGRVGCGIITLQ